LKLKLALAAVTIILVVSLAANAFSYYAQQYRFAINNALQKQAADLRNQINNLQNEKADLQSQLSQLSQRPIVPKLATRLGATDMRYNYTGQTTRLYISGEIWNVGTAPAYNCRLHVTLYQGDIVANDTHIELGTIAAGSWKDVAANIYYEGVALTNWTIISEFG
jgi:cell division protein FtsL